MNLLAFDTSTEFLSIALQRDDRLFTFDMLAGQSHSQRILPEIQQLLAAAELKLNDLDGLAFGAGPGSFTGVRIAAGVAQGLAFGAGLQVVGVCTLMALAEASNTRQVIACLDARMGEVYHAAYVQGDNGWHAVSAPGLYQPNAVPSLEYKGWTAAGSGWEAYGDILAQAYPNQVDQVLPKLVPQATAILRLAQPIFANGQGLLPEQAMPIYIRNRVALKTVEREQGLRL